MTSSTREDKLFTALSARERAVLVLRAWKEGRHEDRQVRTMAPPGQADAFNRYIDLMNGINDGLRQYLLLLRAQVEQLSSMDGWLGTMKLWSMCAIEIGVFIVQRVPEPVTESDYAALRRRSRRKSPQPGRALRYEVYPDTEADKVADLAAARAWVWSLLARAPGGDFLDETERPSDMQRIYREQVERFTRHLCEYWRVLAGIELLVDEASEQFGEDAALPDVREIIDWMRSELIAWRDKMKSTYGEDIDLPEPDDDLMATLRKIAHWPEESAPR